MIWILATTLALAPAGTVQLDKLYTVDGTLPFDRFGAAIAALPDVDGDGTAEVLVGAPNRQLNSLIGRAFVLSGKNGALLRSHAGFNYGDRFGHSVSVLPDVDGDGVGDYAVGAIWSKSGHVYPGSLSVFSGSSGATIADLVGIADGECFGASVSPLGDIDGDGVGDFAAGARFGGAIQGDPATAPGKLRVVSGKDFSLHTEWSGGLPGDFLGWATISMPDLDGDGLADIATSAFGSPSWTKQGQIRIYSSSGAQLVIADGRKVGDEFGNSLAVGPDLDHDGKADLVVGAPGVDSHKGAVYVVSSATGKTLFVHSGKFAGELFGSSVTTIADRTGDGIAELVIGAPGFELQRGRVVVVSPVGTGTVLTNLRGSAQKDELGTTVAKMPDLDGDGIEDLAVGSTGAPAGAGFGRVGIYAVR